MGDNSAAGLSSVFWSMTARRAARWMFGLGVTVVTWLSLTGSGRPDLGFDADLEHFLAYSTLGFMGAAGFADYRSRMLIGAGLILLGIGLEFAQMFVPRRTASLVDGGMDIAGTIVGMALLVLMQRFHSSRGR